MTEIKTKQGKQAETARVSAVVFKEDVAKIRLRLRFC